MVAPFFCGLPRRVKAAVSMALEMVDGFTLKQRKALEAALTSSPDFEKEFRKVIRKEIFAARERIMSGIQFKHGDPRDARRAVRTSVYKQVLGANINIYNSRKAHGTASYQPQRTLRPGQRGGNRRKATAETKRRRDYAPLDRGFILRFLNDGAGKRSVQFRENQKRKQDKWNHSPNTGNRGSIAALHFMKSVGTKEMETAVDNIANIIDGELDDIFNT